MSRRTRASRRSRSLRAHSGRDPGEYVLTAPIKHARGAIATASRAKVRANVRETVPTATRKGCDCKKQSARRHAPLNKHRYKFARGVSGWDRTRIHGSAAELPTEHWRSVSVSTDFECVCIMRLAGERRANVADGVRERMLVAYIALSPPEIERASESATAMQTLPAELALGRCMRRISCPIPNDRVVRN